MLRPEKESLRSKLGGIARSLSVRKSGRRGSGQPIVPLESRPSKTTIPPMNFPDLNESMDSTQGGNVSEAPDFTCRRLSIKFFDDASDRKYKVFRVVMVKDDFIFRVELRRFLIKTVWHQRNRWRCCLIILIETRLKSHIFDSPTLYEIPIKSEMLGLEKQLLSIELFTVTSEKGWKYYRNGLSFSWGQIGWTRLRFAPPNVGYRRSRTISIHHAVSLTRGFPRNLRLYIEAIFSKGIGHNYFLRWFKRRWNWTSWKMGISCQWWMRWTCNNYFSCKQNWSWPR